MLASRTIRVALVPFVGAFIGGSAHAQGTIASSSANPAFETRSELEAQATAAQKRGKTSEAWLLRSRLERGDFQEGDRIVVFLEGASKIDTLQVKVGKVVQFVGMADFSLAGVLRSELTDTLRWHLSKYLKNPGIRATPLFPITVQGAVGAPGYYYISADAVLRDVIMRAGLPNTADLDRVSIKRAGQTIWKSSDVRIALADGISVDRLHLRAGDEVYVAERREGFRVQTVLAVLSASSGIFWMVSQLTR